MLTMFSYDRIVGIIYRHLYLQVRDLMRLFDITYWPLLDLIVWGFGNIALASAGADPSWAIANVICVLFWQVAYRANLEISTNLLEEIWERNLMNLFSTPLKFGEWVIGLLALSIVRIMIMLCICIIAMYYAFSIFIFSIFSIFLFTIFMCWLLIGGWAIGFLNASLVLYFGRKAQSLPWMFAWLWAPFCGIFYPVEVLPFWMQKVSAWLPLTYIFQSTRNFIATGVIPYSDLSVAFFLNAIYFIIGFLVFKASFERSKVGGLSRLE